MASQEEKGDLCEHPISSIVGFCLHRSNMFDDFMLADRWMFTEASHRKEGMKKTGVKYIGLSFPKNLGTKSLVQVLLQGSSPQPPASVVVAYSSS